MYFLHSVSVYFIQLFLSSLKLSEMFVKRKTILFYFQSLNGIKMDENSWKKALLYQK